MLLFPITLVCEKNNVLYKWGKEERAGSVHWLLRCCVSSVSSVKEAHCFIPYPGTEQRFAMQKKCLKLGCSRVLNTDLQMSGHRLKL